MYLDINSALQDVDRLMKFIKEMEQNVITFERYTKGFSEWDDDLKLQLTSTINQFKTIVSRLTEKFNEVSIAVTKLIKEYRDLYLTNKNIGGIF